MRRPPPAAGRNDARGLRDGAPGVGHVMQDEREHEQRQRDCKACGWDDAGWFPDDYQPETTAHVVGWLARQIATHEDGTP